ncbi:TerC family protein [Neobacillus notoginsengisoli]|uniref:TerC family protein n=1 Tax=Neobacillus notoginsengisoli TaxID=1578198 RepID=A0A417YX37_9BACI|nr:TerC family protein [Neobacillus notoginsengisoli]RHW42089.1 TerC family protein [Neobacillus notoginsengisoli]
MELFSPEFWSALFSLVIIDLVLAGDNAIVIGLAARKLPKNQQKKAIIWGTVGAIFIRATATIFVVWLLKIPGLHLIGGILLVWIAYKLLTDESEHNLKAGTSFWAAIKTIIIADAMMGLDNVLAVAGAANGHPLLVIIGLLISIPIVVWGSTIILKWMERYPIIITFGAGVLAFTASRMITQENFLAGFFEDNPILKWGFIAIVIIGVIFAGKFKQRRLAEQH